VVTTSLPAACAVARADALRRSVAEIAVIGGADIYALFMDLADRLEVTEVHASPSGDTRFAGVDTALWQEVARAHHSAGEGDSVDYTYVTYRRRTPR